MVREGIHLNAIYQHYKGGYYKVIDVAQDAEELMPPMVIYQKCDINGIFKSIRYKVNEEEKYVHQPFYTPISRFQGEIPTSRAIQMASLSVVRDIHASELSDGVMLRFRFVKDL